MSLRKKSSTWECINSSYYCFYSVLYHTGRHSASFLLTRAPSLFTVPLNLQLQVPYGPTLFPGWQLDHDLCSQTELKGLLEFPKGRGKRRVCLCIWEISVRQTQREKQESSLQFTTIPNPDSILPRSFELCNCRVLGRNLTYWLHCASTGMYNDKYIPPFFPLILFSFYSLFILSRETSGLPKPRWFEPCNLFYSERG